MSNIVNDQIIENLEEIYPLEITVCATAGDEVIYLSSSDISDHAVDDIGGASDAYRSFINKKFEELPSHE